MSAEIFKSTIRYMGIWASIVKEIGSAYEEAEEILFWPDTEQLELPIDKEVEAVDVDDVFGSSKGDWLKPSPLLAEKNGPKRLQGYHGITMQRSLLNRYRPLFMWNWKEMYKRSGKEHENINKYMTKFGSDVSWE